MTEIIFNNMGFYSTSPYVDWNDKPVERTPDKFRYSYDAYVIYKKSEEYNQTVYSDRLHQWDYEKYNRLSEKHFGNQGQYWNNRDTDKIEAFLRDYYDKPELELIGIMEGCNASSGFPYWIFFFNSKFD